MKKIFIITLISFIAINCFAQENLKPKITVFSEDGHKFWLVIDGKKINEEPKYRVENIEIDNDWARAKVIFKDDKYPMIDKTIQGVDADGKPSEVTYKIMQKNNGKWILRASSWKTLEATTVYQETVNGEETGTTSEGINDETFEGNNATTTTTTTSGEVTGINMNINVDENNGSGTIDVGVNGTNGGVTTTTTMTTTTTSSSVGNTIIAPNPNSGQVATNDEPTTHHVPGYNGPYGCHHPMTKQGFATAKQSIESKTFDDSKVTVAKQIIKSNCMLTSQIKDILGLLSFENDKLEIAKFAYTHTYDKGNYYQINDVFDFSSSIDELNEYISSH